MFMSLFFFFQAEDGIRDFHVTGVQTCALPILYAVKEVGTSDVTGTIVTFTPDTDIFTQTNIYNYDTLANRLRELAFLNKGISLSLRDEREPNEDGSTKEETFFSEGGLKEFIQFLDGNRDRKSTRLN